ncbi:MAG: hypothetical protein ABR583_14385 [Gaiellaceae bacterium]
MLLGGVLAALLALDGGWVGDRAYAASEDLGPTGAALHEAGAALLGALVGLAVAAALVAAFAQAGRAFAAGLAAALAGFLFLLPLFLAWVDDAGIGAAAAYVLVLGPQALIAACVGALAGVLVQRLRRGRQGEESPDARLTV